MTQEYTLLFNGITDTITKLEELTEFLKGLQQRAEELYMNEENQE